MGKRNTGWGSRDAGPNPVQAIRRVQARRGAWAGTRTVFLGDTPGGGSCLELLGQWRWVDGNHVTKVSHFYNGMSVFGLF